MSSPIPKKINNGGLTPPIIPVIGRLNKKIKIARTARNIVLTRSEFLKSFPDFSIKATLDYLS